MKDLLKEVLDALERIGPQAPEKLLGDDLASRVRGEATIDFGLYGPPGSPARAAAPTVYKILTALMAEGFTFNRVVQDGVSVSLFGDINLAMAEIFAVDEATLVVTDRAGTERHMDFVLMNGSLDPEGQWDVVSNYSIALDSFFMNLIGGSYDES